MRAWTPVGSKSSDGDGDVWDESTDVSLPADLGVTTTTSSEIRLTPGAEPPPTVRIAPQASPMTMLPPSEDPRVERLRVSVRASVRDPSLYVVRPLAEGELPPPGTREAFLVFPNARDTLNDPDEVGDTDRAET